MAELNPELQAKLQELDNELEVCLFRKHLSYTECWEWCLILSVL